CAVFTPIVYPSFVPFSFITLSGIPLVIHSFPTRRSSDLVQIEPGAQQLARAGGVGVAPGAERRQLRAVGVQGQVADGTQLAPFRDRKSTRLNSSHVSISYAVFCLTKKSLIEQHEQVSYYK